MWIVWLIGVILNTILVLIWNLCRISDSSDKPYRLPVNMIVAILYIIIAFIPILNIPFAFIWTFVFFNAIYDYDYCDIKWYFPKWMSKKIQ